MEEKGVYKTLLKKDPEYSSYLMGTFSSSLVALPVESFGVGTDRERTTFFVQPEAKVKKPWWPVVYLRAIRLELLGLTLGHALVALLAVWPWISANGFSQHNVWAVGLSLLAVLLGHASACLLNDFQDHLNGADRKSSAHGSRVIQKAWSRAVNVRRWAFVNAGLALLIGVYLLWGNWLILFGLSALTGMAILFYAGMTPFWNRLGAGDFWVTLLFGPLLFFSVWISIFNQEQLGAVDLSSGVFLNGAVLSLCLGLLASWMLQVRQFQEIFKRQEGSFRSLISRMSFDRAKTFLLLEGGLFFSLQAACVWWLWRDLMVTALMGVGALFALVYLWRLRSVVSPLSSQMLGVSSMALRIHGGFVLLWVMILCLI